MKILFSCSFLSSCHSGVSTQLDTRNKMAISPPKGTYQTESCALITTVYMTLMTNRKEIYVKYDMLKISFCTALYVARNCPKGNLYQARRQFELEPHKINFNITSKIAMKCFMYLLKIKKGKDFNIFHACCRKKLR